jgi:hypothetical protein
LLSTEDVIMGSKRLGAALSLALVGLTAAAPEASRSAAESCAPVLGSEVCTWVVMEGGTVVRLGATIPMSLIDEVPADAEMVWPPQSLAAIALPPEAQAALGIDHLGINWEAHGHPPASFMAQHFDFHFFSLSQDKVEAIDCSDESKPSRLPEGYALPDIDVPGMGVLVGLCVPQMGMHAMPAPDVDATDPFEASMMIGYYGGEPMSFEPMVSRALLLERSDFTLPMPVIEGLPAGVTYPTEFRAEYEAPSAQYRLIFSGFDTN